MRSVYQILLVLVSLACASTAQAGLIISLLPDNDTLTIPSSGTAEINFGVTIADNGIGGTTSIQFYTILADIQSPSGKGLPSGWSVTDVTGEFAFPNSFRGFQEDINPSASDVFGGDGSATSTATFGASPTRLFNFTVAIDSTAVPGTYSAVFDTNAAAFELLDSNQAPIALSSIQFNPATVTLQAVPEPSSLLVLGCLSTPALFLRRRRH